MITPMGRGKAGSVPDRRSALKHLKLQPIFWSCCRGITLGSAVPCRRSCRILQVWTHVRDGGWSPRPSRWIVRGPGPTEGPPPGHARFDCDRELVEPGRFNDRSAAGRWLVPDEDTAAAAIAPARVKVGA